MSNDDDAPGRLRSGRRFSRPNANNDNPHPDAPPPAQHTITNDRDTNPPPPDETEFSYSSPNDDDVDESQLSPSLLSVDIPTFTTIGRAHEGRATTTLQDAHTQPSASIPSPNQFGALAQDDESSDEPSHTDDDAPTEAIDNIFREADATLAAATYDFELMSERLRIRLDHDLTASITKELKSDMDSITNELKSEMKSTKSNLGKSIEQTMLTFSSMIQQNVDDSTLAFERRIEERIASMEERIARTTESTAKHIELISANTNELARETTALSVRMVEHQSHLENLLGFEEARRQQMDDHVKQMLELAALIAEVKSDSTTQTQRVSAQLDGLRAKVESHNNTTKTDIVDLRGRIVPELRGQHDAIVATVKRLENRLDSTDTTTSQTINDLDNRLTAFRAEFDEYTNNPTVASTPRRTNVPDTVTIDDPTGIPVSFGEPTGVPSLPRSPLFPNVDPTTLRTASSWHAPPATTDSAYVRPHPIDTSPAEDDTVLIMGGRITSPRATDKERQARKLNISRHDIAGLATTAYHGGRQGVPILSLNFIHACGYQSFSPEIEDDVLPCYGAIQLLHKKITMAWTNSRTQQSGPSVERILEKGLTVLPKLRGTSARETVSFYESLQQVSTSYLMPIMPFDTVCIANNYEGLFPPGLGTDVYCECCIALLEVLPRLLPQHDYEVSAKISGVRNSSRNGYDLLWRVLELFVPGFDPTIPIAQPVWTNDSSILDFCQSHILYFRLQAKKNMFFSSRDRTTIFLRAVTPSEYADVVTSLMTSVDAYRHPDNDGILPDHLRLDGIATLIHNNAKHRVRDLHSPRIHRVAGMGTIWDDSTEDEAPYCHIQGYRPQAFRMDGNRQSDGFRPRGDEFNRQRGGNDGRYGARPSRPPSDKPQGRYARPDQRRREYKAGVQCDACKRPGHEAINCDMLAIALYIDRYTKDIGDDERSKVESRWLERWKAKLGQPARTPRQVMRTFCENYNITPDNLDCAMDWDCWPECDPTDSDLE